MIATEEPPTLAKAKEATAPPAERVYGPDPREGYATAYVEKGPPIPRPNRARDLARGFVVCASVALAAGGLIAGVGYFLHEAAPEPVDLKPAQVAAAAKRLTRSVKAVVAGYFAAPTIGEKLDFVCEPERVGPLMADHYALHPLEPRTVERIEIFATMTRFVTKHPHVFVSVIDSEKKVSIAILRQFSDGVRIDWEAQEAHNALGLGDMIRLHPAGETTLRVMARPSDYYNFEFIDQEKWQAFVLWNPNEPGAVLQGYCERGSAVCQALLELTAGGHAVAAQLVVGFSQALNGDDTLEIRRIAAPHWFGGDA